MDIYPYTHVLCSLEEIEHGQKKMVKVGSGHCFVGLGVCVRVLTPITGHHSNVSFA